MLMNWEIIGADRRNADNVRVCTADSQDLQDKVGGRRKLDHAGPVLHRLIPVDALWDLFEEQHPDHLQFCVLLNAVGGSRAIPQVQEKPLSKKVRSSD